MKKYYLAYDERYKKVHSEGILWFSKNPTPDLLKWIEYYNISKQDKICEVGCGEGRDALYLGIKGYKVKGIDASESAINKCKELANKNLENVEFEVEEIINLDSREITKYKWIYAVGVLHMLVDDSDRNLFLKSIYNMLDRGGHALLVNMGNGEVEGKTDTSKAFEIQERNNNSEGKKVMVASTSYRSINWKNHIKELEDAGFLIEKTINTQNNEYGNCMVVYLKKS
ncbi:class I SAM-dependent methyltransferase [Paraclostridium sp. AKS81]|uniref:class I SAM-dependent methyltransferase n=1 Tax=Paraclostridium sp. AKS81 TaxID=2876117 RepID=UPI0021DFC378|nr:class I SAM-dependent methyltransferase [Paraclostridium sp. AKS81]MCU9812794.1 class I SAM-dependent methyltransferase [Paraclostridium sp. AKS81]